MKKFLALCLSLCVMLSCVAVPAFAAEVSTDSQVSEDENGIFGSGASIQNTDWYTFSDNAILDGYSTIAVTPGSGQALKIHVYLKSGRLKVWIRPASSSSWTSIADWNTIGHHYADLVSSTNGGTYYIRLWGSAAWFSGGIYTEP